MKPAFFILALYLIFSGTAPFVGVLMLLFLLLA